MLRRFHVDDMSYDSVHVVPILQVTKYCVTCDSEFSLVVD